jgi:hypothetical protein
VVHKPDRDSFIGILNARAKSTALERPIHDQIIYTRLESQIMVSKLHLSTCARSVGVLHKFSISALLTAYSNVILLQEDYCCCALLLKIMTSHQLYHTCAV